MHHVRTVCLLVVVFAVGCSSSDRDDPKSPQNRIIGRWEGDAGGIEFTSSGSVFELPKQELGQYRFINDRTIEVSLTGQSGRLTDVSVSRNKLSFTVDGKTIQLRRVKEFSAALLARSDATPRPSSHREESKAVQANESDEQSLEGVTPAQDTKKPETTNKLPPELTPPQTSPNSPKVAPPDPRKNKDKP